MRRSELGPTCGTAAAQAAAAAPVVKKPASLKEVMVDLLASPAVANGIQLLEITEREQPHAYPKAANKSIDVKLISSIKMTRPEKVSRKMCSLTKL